MTVLYLAVAIVLVIATLVVRDQTEFKLSRLRAELMALRSEEQRLAEEHTELERMVAQTGDALMRADHRHREINRATQELVDVLSTLGVDLDLPGDGDDGASEAASS